jgi:hypothetical protein
MRGAWFDGGGRGVVAPTFIYILFINITQTYKHIYYICHTLNKNKSMSKLQSNQPSKNALDFYEKAEDVFANLKSRWQEESEYEDINDYKLPLEPIAKETNVIITKMTKRPFGCEFTTDGRTFKISLNDRSYLYKRIK